jgi:hypothetical protein
MEFSVHDVFYSKCSQQHVSAAITAIFRVILLQEYVLQMLTVDVGYVKNMRKLFTT